MTLIYLFTKLLIGYILIIYALLGEMSYTNEAKGCYTVGHTKEIVDHNSTSNIIKLY